MMLQGRKVVLRPAAENDRRQIFEWLTMSDLTSKMIGPPDFEDNEIPSWEYFLNDYNPHFFTDDDPDQGRSYVLEAEGQAVGHINYNEIDRTSNTVELDIWLRSSLYCNRGYGSDAIITLCQYLQEHLLCNRLILAPSARNGNAIHVYEKCGFKVTNEIFSNFTPDYQDTVVMIREVNQVQKK